ncbi:hypothetical protein CL630_03315 [bacterium]|nr:hypothetical protein [bacterium]|tara:strand:- start:197 stop:973 length:777 start_codon:yes stop_codon:yes gene_type:complete
MSIEGMPNTPNENESEPKVPHLEFGDIREELENHAVLRKEYDEGEKEEIIKGAGLSEEEWNKVRSPKEQYHILRLLGRAGAKQDFAVAYTNHYGEQFLGSEEAGDVRKTTLSEEADTMMFWTFAPYLFKYLKEKGIDDGTAIKKIGLWAAAATKERRQSVQGDMHLEGLEFLNKQQRGEGPILQAREVIYILDKDSEHVSHKFTEQEAERVAELLLAKDESKQEVKDEPEQESQGDDSEPATRKPSDYKGLRGISRMG